MGLIYQAEKIAVLGFWKPYLETFRNWNGDLYKNFFLN